MAAPQPCRSRPGPPTVAQALDPYVIPYVIPYVNPYVIPYAQALPRWCDTRPLLCRARGLCLRREERMSTTRVASAAAGLLLVATGLWAFPLVLLAAAAWRWNELRR
jgi:hypothetical protein